MTWIGRQTRQRKFDPRESLGGTSIAKHRMVRTKGVHRYEYPIHPRLTLRRLVLLNAWLVIVLDGPPLEFKTPIHLLHALGHPHGRARGDGHDLLLYHIHRHDCRHYYLG